MPAEVPRHMASGYMRAHGVTVDNAAAALQGAVTIGHGPIADIAVDGDTLVVSNYADHSMAVLNAETLAVNGGVAAREAFALAVAGDSAYVGVASVSYDAIAVIDTRTGNVTASYPLSFSVTAMTTSRDGKRIYAGRAADGGVDVAIIDVITQRVSTIYLAKGDDVVIDAMRVDSSDRRLYVATSDSRGSRLIVVDLESGVVRRTLEVGASIRGLEIGLDSTAYVLTSDLQDRGVLHVVDLVAGRIMASVEVATAPTQLALSADATRAYVVDYNEVVVLDTEKLDTVGTISVGARPSCVALGVDRLYVADYAGGVTAFAVAAPAPMLYAPLMAANSAAAVPTFRELEPAGV
jgi:DNA-binding beta-propeller fold protein YncE